MTIATLAQARILESWQHYQEELTRHRPTVSYPHPKSEALDCSEEQSQQMFVKEKGVMIMTKSMIPDSEP